MQTQLQEFIFREELLKNQRDYGINSPCKKKQRQVYSKKKSPLYIFCFGDFNVFTDQQLKYPVVWRTNKAKELFAYFVHNIDKFLPLQKILSDIWPDMSQQKASDLFHTSLSYIRQILKSSGGNRYISYNNYSYSIFLGETFCDYLLFDHLIKQSLLSKDKLNIKLLQYSVSLYKGEYFDKTDYEWALENTEYYSNLNVKILFTISENLMIEKKYESALFYLKKIVKIDPVSERAYVMIMEAFYHIGDKQSLVNQYQKLCNILMEELGIGPNRETKKIFYQFINFDR